VVQATRSGRCDAVAIWLELGSGDRRVSTAAAFSAAALATGGAGSVGGVKAASSVKQGLCYLDSPVQLTAVQVVRVQLQPGQENTSLHVSLGAATAPAAAAAPALRSAAVPRHALLPAWHYTMLADAARNTAFDAAIR